MRKEISKLILTPVIILLIVVFALNINVLTSQAQSNPTNTPSKATATPQPTQNSAQPVSLTTATSLPDINSISKNNAAFSFKTLG